MKGLMQTAFALYETDLHVLLLVKSLTYYNQPVTGPKVDRAVMVTS